MAKQRKWRQRLNDNAAFLVLASLLSAAFLMGGSARGDTVSLILLRPLSALALAYGLYLLARDGMAAWRYPIIFLAAVCGLLAAHLIPLPPALWTALPGRYVAQMAASAVAIEEPWRPLTLVPWRGWNALFAMMAPAATLLLAIRCTPQQHGRFVRLIVGFGLLSTFYGVLHAIGDYQPNFYLYRIHSEGAPTGLFANKNHQAFFLSLLLPMLALIARETVGQRATAVRLGVIGAAAAVLFVILASGSRAGLALAFLGIGASLLFYRVTGSEFRGGKARLYLWLSFLLVVVTVGLLAFSWSRAQGLERILHSDATEEGRFDQWAVSAQIMWHYFPFGSGAGSFVEIYKIYEPTNLLSLHYWNHAHNDFLEWSFEFGLAGMILIAIAAALWTRQTWKLRTRVTSKSPTVHRALLGSYTIFVLGLCSLVDYPMRVPSLSCLVALAAIWLTTPLPERGLAGRND